MLLSVSSQLSQCLSIDEQIVPFKGRHGLMQYLPKKPHKWGYKVYVLSGISGYAYDIKLYAGKLGGMPLLKISWNAWERSSPC